MLFDFCWTADLLKTLLFMSLNLQCNSQVHIFVHRAKNVIKRFQNYFIENHSIRISWNKIYPLFRIQNFTRWFWVGSKHILQFLQNIPSDFLPNCEKWKLHVINHFSLSDIINLILCIDSFFVSLSPIVTSCLHGSGNSEPMKDDKFITNWRVELVLTKEHNWDSLFQSYF